MNDDDNNPKKPFNLAADPKTDINAPDTKDDDDRTVAEKDNTQNKINPPTFAMSSSASNAPTGSVPVDLSEEEVEIDFVPYDPAEHPINLGTDDLTVLWEDNGYTVKIKQEDQQHPNGIDGGRISRLALEKDGDAPVYFDYGEWVRSPTSPLEIQMVDEIKEDLNHAPKKEFKGFHDPDPDNDPEI